MTDKSDGTPLKTWSYLATGSRRRPSEYEVVSAGLHYHTLDAERPWELDPEISMAQWYKRCRNQSPLTHPDWDAFRDPDEMIYRTCNIFQDSQENYVQGLFDQFNECGHDALLEPAWVRFLVRSYTPARYAFHSLQMGSAYVQQIAPASTISNCATYTSADHLRWTTYTAYRTCALANAYPQAGFASTERACWEDNSHWQGLRALLEHALVASDWAEAFTAIFLVAKPVVEKTLLTEMGNLARGQGDILLGLLSQAQMRDAERHRRWLGTLLKMALEIPAKRVVLQTWLAHRAPLGCAAIDAYCAAFDEDGAAAATRAKNALRQYHQSLGLES